MSPGGAGIVLLVMRRNVRTPVRGAIDPTTLAGVLRHAATRMLARPLDSALSAFVRTRTSEGR